MMALLRAKELCQGARTTPTAFGGWALAARESGAFWIFFTFISKWMLDGFTIDDAQHKGSKLSV
jgi:hypothetical protein